MKKTGKKILVVAAHPDDEALGCGGTIARHKQNGDTVFLLFMTDGVGARGVGQNQKERNLNERNQKERTKAAEKAAKILGVKTIIFNAFPDNEMDSVPLLQVVKAVEDVVAAVKPNIVYTHHAGDLNIDHRVVHQAVLTACRPMPGSTVESIYGFEVLSSTEWAGPAVENAFLPAHFVNIEKSFSSKMKALKAYRLEMRPFPHARSYEAVEALATLRGVQVGVSKAEAFTVIRSIRK